VLDLDAVPAEIAISSPVTEARPSELLMSPKIAVASTVRLYFESPAAKPAKKKTAKLTKHKAAESAKK
jgi:hypothetical protein